ncbi:MAG TPA: hypothetical protein VN317_03765 [Candidatus Methanoperedens sp.]|nr:hypothetical protein [Candidatus Methanoperedens sp.]
MVVTGAFTAVVLYERLFVEKTFGPSAIVGVAILLSIFFLLLATYVLQGTRHQAAMGKLWLAGTSVAVSYVALDLLAGFFLIRPLSPALVPDEYLHHKLVPNSNSRLEQRDFSYIQRVNNFGLRGRDISLETPPNTYRILMLGDSFTMGKGVEDDQTFSALLEKSLNAEASKCGGRSVEVLNGGVDSYAPILSLLELERNLGQLKPDMVILNFDASDLVQESAYRREAVYGPGGEVVAVPMRAAKKSLNDRVRLWAERHLFFTRFLLFSVNKLFGYRSLTTRELLTQANLEVVAHTLTQDDAPRDSQWKNVFASIGGIKEYCASRGIEFVLSIYPWAHQVSETEWIPGRYNFMPRNATPSDRSADILRVYAADKGIELVDAFPVFRRYRGQEALFFKYDMHWTAAGNKVMAQGLEDHLRQRHPWLGCR